MKRRTLFKILAIVSMMNVTVDISIAQTAGTTTPKPNTTAGGVKPAAAAAAPAASTTPGVNTNAQNNVNSGRVEFYDPTKSPVQDRYKSREQDERAKLKDFETKCEGYRKEEQTSQANFLAYCKQEESSIAKGANSEEKQRAAAIQCGKDLAECSSFESEEMNLGLNVNGGALPETFPYGSSSEKRCSKLSENDHRSQIEKMETKLDTKNETVNKLQEKHAEATKKATEDSNDLMEKFMTAEEEKAQAEAQTEEESAAKLEAFNKQMDDYEKNLKTIENEIFQLQQQQSIFTRRRGEEVDTYKTAILVCEEQIREKFGKATPQVVGSRLKAYGEEAMRKRLLKTNWERCTKNALNARVAAAEDYRSKMEQIDRAIQIKTQEVNKMKESANRVKQSYADAVTRQGKLKAKQEEAFINKQKQKITKIQQVADQIKSKTLENAQAIEKAQRSVNSVSNQLRTLQSEKPVGDKPLPEIKKEFQKFMSAKSSYDSYCTDGKRQEMQQKIKAAEETGIAQ